MAALPNAGSVQSIDRALDIIEVLAAEADSMSITNICQKTALQKSTVHRLLATLKNRNYVVQDRIGHYRLSLKITSLSQQFVTGFSLVKVAVPALKQLCADTQETVHLVMREGDATVYLHREEFHNAAIRVVSNIGQYRPLHSTAVGKSILAKMTDDEIAEYWKRADKTVVTKNTIRQLPKLMDTLKKARRVGYATDFEENTYGVNCMAVALPYHTGRHDIAVSVTGPKERMTVQQMKACFPLLDRAREEISAHLGFA